MKDTEHFQPGHLNALVLDHDSVITGYGKHDRVVCFLPDASGQLYMRVDHKWSLGMPSESQLLDVARKNQGVRGEWEFYGLERHDDGHATDFYFIRSNGPRA